MKRVLAIDGGGIRGVIPALVLAELEQLTGQPAARSFDLIAGTSTGGLLALALCIPSSAGSLDPRYSANDLVSMYTEKGRSIFGHSPWQSLRSLWGLSGAKYSSALLARTLSPYFRDTRLSEAITDALITGYEIEQRAPWFFRSWKSRQHDERDFSMLDVALATTAAPTYFAPARLVSDTGRGYLALVDGGVCANNPALAAYSEMRHRFPSEDLLVVSLGSGRSRRSILFDSHRGWGLLKWGRSVLDVVFDGTSRVVDYQMNQILGRQYFRFQLELQSAHSDMDDASPRHLRQLIADAATLITNEKRRLREVSGLL